MHCRRLGCLVLLVTVWGGASASSAPADEVIGAKNSKVYHTHPKACSHARRIGPENVIHFASAEEAEKAGRRLCKQCAALDRRKPAEDAGDSKEGKSEPQNTAKRFGSAKQDGERPPTGSVAALPEFARVSGILPGGTIELDNGEKARLLGVVCPQEDQRLAEDAVRFIDEQTCGRSLRLARDVFPPNHLGGRDALGRLLVYVTPEPDGRDLGGELIFQGYAWVDRGARFERRAEYARREEEAWRASRGIWKPLKGAAGEEQVVIGRHAFHYHDPGCSHVAHLTSAMTVTVNEAKSRRLPPCPRYHVKDDKKKKHKNGDKKDRKPQS